MNENLKEYPVGYDLSIRGPMLLNRIGFVYLKPGNTIKIKHNNNVIYTYQHPNNSKDNKVVRISVDDVSPYPNVNFNVDGTYLLPGDGIKYAQEIIIMTDSNNLKIEKTTKMDK